MKFTIVDTSLVHGEERSKVKLLKSLPIDTTNVSSPSCLSCETDQDISEEWEDEAEEINTSNPLEDVTARGACADSAECVTSILDNGVPADPSIAAVENHEGQSTGAYDDEQSTKKMKYQFSRNAKSGHSKYLAPVTRQQLTASGNEDSRHSRESKLNEENSHFQSNSPDACENMPFQEGPSQNLSSTSSSAQGTCLGGSNEGTLNENCLDAELLPEKPLPLKLIDLNLPHIPPDFGTDEPFAMDMVHNHDNPCANKLSTPSETSEQPEPLKISDGGASIEQPSIMNGRRQSTRNRPLTTKALEALACGFFNTKRKRKRVEALPQNNSMPRSSRRVCEDNF
ncbi:hypothetical protein L1049_003800 [Liquidambar formosana]|uniref:Uncharacterized protein n=1 Tax=Liquidambar formosana TaxID=63359 RepID=A0AAP0RR97_LIQFO